MTVTYYSATAVVLLQHLHGGSVSSSSDPEISNGAIFGIRSYGQLVISISLNTENKLKVMKEMMETNGTGTGTGDTTNSDQYMGWYNRFQEMYGQQLPDKYMKYLVLDYLISQGYREAAEYLCEDASIPFPRDAIENLDQRMRIRDDIVEGKIQEAIEKVLKVVPSLLERNPVLHLRLLQQHLIELIRNRLVEEAVAFTQSIVEKVDEHPEMEKEMQKAFAMIAFERPEDSPYTYLLELSHRQMVANDVNSAILEALNKPSAPKLEGLFQCILWAKKLLKHNDTAESLDRLFGGEVTDV